MMAKHGSLLAASSDAARDFSGLIQVVTVPPRPKGSLGERNRHKPARISGALRQVGDMVSTASITNGAAVPKRAPRRRGGIGPISAALMVCLLAWYGGLVWFVDGMPTGPPGGADLKTRTDGIVVLTGGSRRLAVGLDLLAQGQGRALLVSGVHQDVALPDLLRIVPTFPRRLADRVTLGYRAGNTIGNAAETAAWMRKRGFTSVRLVTANYHLRRSLLELRRAMPEATIVPHPVMPDGLALDAWWRDGETARLILAEYNKYLIAVVRTWVAPAPVPGRDLLY